MKKYAILFLFVTVLCVSFALFVGMKVGATQDDVVLTEHTVFGDVRAADGLTVTSGADLGDHLFWNTVYTLGADSAPHTETRYCVTRDRSGNGSVVTKPQITLSTEVRAETDFTQAVELTGMTLSEIKAQNFDVSTQDGRPFREVATDPALGLSAAYNALYMDAPIGEEVSMRVTLSDYYDYYPIDADVSIPTVYWSNNDYIDGDHEKGSEFYARKVFMDYFKIPMPDDITMEIHLTRSDVSGMSWGSSVTADKDNTFHMNTVSAGTATDCYFAFDAHTYNGDIVDTSEIKGGFGIYRVSYHKASGSDCGLDADSLAMVYPLDPSHYIHAMYTDNTDTQLFLVTEDRAGAGELILSVIDLATMTPSQEFTYSAADIGYFRFLYISDTFTVLVSDRALVVYTEENGFYTEEFAVLSYDNDDGKYTILDYGPMAFDGERLAVGYFNAGPYQMRQAGYWIAVYTKDGCGYLGEYHSSLAAGANASWSSDYDIDTDGLVLSWEPGR